MPGLIGRLNKDIGPVFDREAFAHQARTVAQRGAGPQGVRYAGPIAFAYFAGAELLNERPPLPYQDDSARFVVLFDGYPLGRPAQNIEALTQAAQTLLEGFHRNGIAATLAALPGSFALACMDWQRGELHLARSADGLYPLFWADLADAFCFASTLPATQSDGGDHLLQGDPATKPHDETALPAYRYGGFIPADRTLAAGIRQVSPGSIFTLRLQDWSQTEKPIPLLPAMPGSPWLDTLRHQLRQTIDIQDAIVLTGDGGIGGALLAALLHNMGARQVALLLPPKELKLNTLAIELCAKQFGYQTISVSHADLAKIKLTPEAPFLAANGTPTSLVWALWLKAAQDAGHTVVSALGFLERYLPNGLPIDMLLKPTPPAPSGFWVWLKGLFGTKPQTPAPQLVDRIETAQLAEAFARQFAHSKGIAGDAATPWPVDLALYTGPAAEVETRRPLDTWAQLQAQLSPDASLLYTIDTHTAQAAQLRVVAPYLAPAVWQAWLGTGTQAWLGTSPDAAFYQHFKQISQLPAAAGNWPQALEALSEKK